MRILVAEDDAHTRAALIELLNSDGHQCFGAADGDQAASLFNDLQPELVCLAVMKITAMSGFSLRNSRHRS